MISRKKSTDEASEATPEVVPDPAKEETLSNGGLSRQDLQKMIPARMNTGRVMKDLGVTGGQKEAGVALEARIAEKLGALLQVYVKFGRVLVAKLVGLVDG